MNKNAISIRPFIGATDFETSRQFYRDLGFEETTLAPGFIVFRIGELRFYLQDADVRDWIDNTQLFLEVEDVQSYYDHLCAMNLPTRYPGVRLEAIRYMAWGSECFLHDPSGILWHIGNFKK